MARKKVMFVFGTRPEAIKMAPLILEMQKHPASLQPVIVSTGQHKEMLEQVLRIFSIRPDHDLKIMQASQSLPQIVSRTLAGMEEVLKKEQPDMLLVQGDTSTAFAAGLNAFYARIPLGHVEAGLRTGDKLRPYPEEVNRRLLSVVCDLHFAPTKTAVRKLLSENIPKDTVFCTGNTVIDVLLLTVKRKFDLKKTGIHVDPRKKTILVTVHRRESFGEPMRVICRSIKKLADKYRDEINLILPVHKNPIVRKTVLGILGKSPNISVVEPLDYEPFVHLMKAAYFILTDSGGVQEEAPSLGKPVLVLREKTERPEAIKAGTVRLVGVNGENIFKEAEQLLKDQKHYKGMQKEVNPYGDGLASERITQIILRYFGLSRKTIKEFNPK